MVKFKGRMDESILVCVHYAPNGERLILRGCKIASMLQCPLYILTIDPKPFDELDAEKSDYISKWQKLAKKHNVDEFIIKTDERRPIVKIIGEVAREKHVTQIILGQTAKSRLQHITKGSIIDDLLRELQFIDLHIVSVARFLKTDSEGSFEKGVRAYLVKQGENYELSFNHTPEVKYEGIFFKELGTDFNNGFFKFMKNGETIQVHVIENMVNDLKNVNITPSIDSN